MKFTDFQFASAILKAIQKQGYVSPTPIQEQTIPQAMEGKDVLGCAQTGTGKTAAFAIPVLHQLQQNPPYSRGKRPISALILTPTRELAIQIAESFQNYGAFTALKSTVIFGGVSQHKQVEALKSGVDILIATPGRLLDLMQQQHIQLDRLKHFVLDEADRMLDMGFLNDVKKVIAKLPKKRQSLFFSATMPKDIVQLANSILNEPIRVEVTPVSSTAKAIEQYVYFVDKVNKKHLLKEVLQDEGMDRVLVFTRTKHGANKVVKDLVKNGIKALAIHGNKSQTARQKALNSFKSNEIRVLVATDIAARGIDIDDLAYVINYELPNIAESYVHRIGRTGRAGLAGTAIAFCDAEEKAYLKDIQKLIGKSIPVLENKNFPLVQHHIEKKKPNQHSSSRKRNYKSKAKQSKVNFK